MEESIAILRNTLMMFQDFELQTRENLCRVMAQRMEATLKLKMALVKKLADGEGVFLKTRNGMRRVTPVRTPKVGKVYIYAQWTPKVTVRLPEGNERTVGFHELTNSEGRTFDLW